MKHLFPNLILIFITIATFTYGQQRKLHIPNSSRWFQGKFYKGNKPTTTYKFMQQIISWRKLEQLHHSPHPFHFRVFLNFQTVEIWQDASGKPGGKIVTWADEVNKVNDKLTGIHYKGATQLDNSQIRQIKQLIDSTQVMTIPHEALIKGWNLGWDGITFYIEYCTQKDYFFKSYWSPYAFTQLWEAKIIDKFINRIMAIVKAEKQWEQVPFRCYSVGNRTFYRSNFTDKQHSRLQKYRRNFRKRKNKD